MRAVKWHTEDQAIKRLEDTLRWRREFGIYGMKASYIEPEASRPFCLSNDLISVLIPLWV